MKRIRLLPGILDAAKARNVPQRRTPIGILALVRNNNIEANEKVFQMARAGLSEAQMAALLEMEENDLRLNYARTILKGQADGVWQIAQQVLNGALGNASLDREQMAAAMFWLRTKAGWLEQSNVGPTKPGESAGAQLTDAERRRKLARVLKFAGASAARGLLAGISVAPKPGPTD